MPIAAFLARARHQLSFADFPTLFWLGVNDTALTIGVCPRRRARARRHLRPLAAHASPWPRRSRSTSASPPPRAPSSAFQWDNLLLECAFFAIFLPRDRRSPWMHTLFRLILLKLYWESGVAKWQSHLHDWQDGSAMTYYYETAPLPTALAWYVHHAPSWWHHARVVGDARLRARRAVRHLRRLSSRTARLRRHPHQLPDHQRRHRQLRLLLLPRRRAARLPARRRRRQRASSPGCARALRLAAPDAARRAAEPPMAALGGCAILYAVFVARLGRRRAGQLRRLRHARSPCSCPLRRVCAPFRVVNTYHLFGHITRARIEADFQTTDDGTTLDRARFPPQARRSRSAAPTWVAPHQPRVDFQLWFYGLGYRGGTPEYVATLVERLCRDPAAVQPLFRTPPLAAPESGAHRLLAVPLHDRRRAPRDGRLVDARAGRPDRGGSLRHALPRAGLSSTMNDPARRRAAKDSPAPLRISSP